MATYVEHGESIASRIRSPLIAFFCASWIFHNWELLLGLFTIRLPYDDFAYKLSPFFNFTDLLFIPLLKALILIVLHIILGLFVHLLYDLYAKFRLTISDWVNNKKGYLERENELFRASVNALITNSYAKEIVVDNSQDTLEMIKDYSDEAKKFHDIFEKQFDDYRNIIDPNSQTQSLPPKPKNKDLFIKNGIMEIRNGQAFYTNKGLFILFQIYPQLNKSSINRIKSEAY